VSTLFSILTTDIVPIFLIAGAGFVLARFFDASVKSLTQVVFHVLLPCFVFHLLMTEKIGGPQVVQMVALAALSMILTGVLGYVVARGLKLGRAEFSAFLLVVMFSNGGNYGLPVVSFAFGPSVLPYATVYFLTGSVMTYTIGGFLAASGQHSPGRALLDVFKMPSLYGSGSALLLLSLHVTVPAALMRPIGMMADSALPLMILILGMQLERVGKPAKPGLAMVAVALSLLVTPIVAFGLCSLLHVPPPGRQAAVVLASMPVAVTTSILALKYDAAPDFVISAILFSTLLSPLTLTPIIALLQ
jgi:malate permease and related proteins